MKFNRLSSYKIKKILKYFCEEITATQTARLMGLNRKTINRYFHEFREAILKASLAETAKGTGVFEMDESYFGAKSTFILHLKESEFRFNHKKDNLEKIILSMLNFVN